MLKIKAVTCSLYE